MPKEASMRDLLAHIAQQLDKLDDKLDSVDRTLVKQEVNLAEHMSRTEILEEQHQLLYNHMDAELQPIKAHVDKRYQQIFNSNPTNTRNHSWNNIQILLTATRIRVSGRVQRQYADVWTR